MIARERRFLWNEEDFRILAREVHFTKDAVDFRVKQAMGRMRKDLRSRPKAKKS